MTEQQAALVERARPSIQAAGLLTDGGMHDFSVSRACFSMFRVTEAFLLEHGVCFSEHSTLDATFGKHFVTTGRLPAHLHRDLIDVFDARSVADYDVGPTTDRDAAETLIGHAEQFVRLAEERLGGS